MKTDNRVKTLLCSSSFILGLAMLSQSGFAQQAGQVIPFTPAPQQVAPVTPVAPTFTPAPVTSAPIQSGAIQPTAVNPRAVGLPSVADLVESVSPAVVNVIARSDDGTTTSEGEGSGFVISAKGEVVTNYHVIEGATDISVAFANTGREYPIKIVGTDEETDLAVLQIQANHGFPYVQWHKGKPVRIGEWVVAIGNPFGIGQSTSLGVISAIGGRERVDSGAFVDYIQTDATINRGNSGGPLFDLKGNVVGVNSAIYSPTGASVGIGFVIPHQAAEWVVNTLRRDGRVQRGFLGVGLRTAEYSADSDPSFRNGGATVNNVVPGSPAQQYGLEMDDVILSVNGVATRNSVEATREIAKAKPGQRVTFVVERQEKMQNVAVVVGERPKKEQLDRQASGVTGYVPQARDSGRADTKPKVSIDTGLILVDLSSSFRDAIGMRPDQVGVYIESIDQASKAVGTGLRAGMVVLEANNKPVADTKAFKSIVLNAKLAQQSSMYLKVRQADGQVGYANLPL